MNHVTEQESFLGSGLGYPSFVFLLSGTILTVERINGVEPITTNTCVGHINSVAPITITSVETIPY